MCLLAVKIKLFFEITNQISIFEDTGVCMCLSRSELCAAVHVHVSVTLIINYSIRVMV